jgi:formylglycine-generating enzyme required for sulfatase activity
VADVFLSYNREDQPKAKLIAEALERAGFKVWWDTVLRAGQTYDEVTERQLRDAWAVVVLWSSRSVQSKWVRAEATLGERKSALIPVMIEPCERPIMFELIQTADLTNWQGDLTDPNWKAFLADVREHVERKRDAEAAAAKAAASVQAQDRKSVRKKRGGGGLFLGVGLLAAAAAGFLFWRQYPQTFATLLPAALVTQTAASSNGTPTSFSDCEGCPQMMRLPGSSFAMGSPETEIGRRGWEGQQREVRVPAFAISAHEITLAQWDACYAAGSCGGYTPPDRGWGRGAHPALMVSWNDAQAYVQWLSERSGRRYRLPSEAEWEYAARAGATSAYWWGANYDASQVTLGRTSEVGAHAANGFGLFDVAGNIAEWVEDCYVNSYTGAPSDGRPMLEGACDMRVVRGGSWRDNASGFRLASRSRINRATRDGGVGFRVAASE